MILGQRRGVSGIARIDGCDLAIRLAALESDDSAETNWRAWDPPESPRQQLYVETWRRLRDLSDRLRADAMRQLHEVFAVEEPARSDFPMSREEVARLVTAEGIEIGAHSQTHPPLTILTPDERRREIDGSRADCEALAGRPVTGFAYPYGDRDAETMAMVQDSGFGWACSTHSAGVDPRRFDRFDLPRLQVLNWNGAAFADALQNVRCLV
jgi:peptidoglycan/xylan/chitin deacetylase (PgdA/CDA1 family)